MSIERVKLLGIKGNSKDLDRFLANVLFNSDIQIEDAKKIYNKGWKLEYFEYDYKIKETLKKCENLLNKLGIQYTKDTEMVMLENMAQDIQQKIEEVESEYDKCVKTIENSQKDIQEMANKMEVASRVKDIDIDMEKLYDLKYIKFRYGSISKRNLNEIKQELENLNIILFEVKDEGDSSWIIYFTTQEFVSEVDGIFNIQKFERELLPDDLIKTPKEYLKNLKESIIQKEKEINEAKKNIENIKKEAMTKVLGIYRELQTYDKINTIKKYIVHDQNGSFYVVAWIPERNLHAMKKRLDGLPDIDYVVRDGENPPTKLKNNKIIKPFEELVKLYGMPRMDELDPTWFVALTTFIMFGFMFGDVGHRTCIFNYRYNFIIKKEKNIWSNTICRRLIFYNFWGFIWKCFWKRRYYKTCFN